MSNICDEIYFLIIITMANFFQKFNALKLKENLLNVIFRFPISIAIIFVFCALLFFQLHWDINSYDEEIISKLIFTCVVTFFFSVWVYLNSESFLQSNAKKNLLQLFPLIYGIVFFYWMEGNFMNNHNNLMFFILSLFWIVAYLFFAPYVRHIFSKESEQTVYYNYFYKISVVFLVSAILWWVLSLLGTIWIGTVTTLFELYWEFYNKLFWDWIILALAFFSPIFALTQLPASNSFNQNNFVENKFFSFLVKYIAIPFIYIYFIILYTYSIKILINFWSWPKWEVCWMVIGFSIFGYLIYIFSFIFEETNNFIKKFRKYFPFAVIPQLFMLAFAIYLRIAQYDITMNRYFVVVFGLWLAIISFYLIFSKKKYLGFIPFLLTIFTIMISVWPRSVYKLPEQRQLVRLETNLIKANILQNWKIVPLKNYSDIDKDLSNEIYNWIDYLCDLNSCNSIKKLFPEQYKIAQEENDNLNLVKGLWDYFNKFRIVSSITKSLNIKKSSTPSDYSQKYTVLNIKYDESIYPLDIGWYSKILEILKNSSDSKLTNYAKFYINEEKIEIYENGKVVDNLDLKDVFKKLETSYKNANNKSLPKKDMIFDINNYKVIFKEVSIKNQKNGTTTAKNLELYYSVEWFILVK